MFDFTFMLFVYIHEETSHWKIFLLYREFLLAGEPSRYAFDSNSFVYLSVLFFFFVLEISYDFTWF